MRLITRSDFDGLACAAILKELGIVDEIVHAHPKDIQDGKISVTDDDVLANVPFVPGCGLWFDHHSSEHERLNLAGKFVGASDAQPSCARVVYNYYNNDELHAEKLKRFDEMLLAVDIADSGRYTREDITHPRGWMMLAFIADPRTGLGYYQHFRTSNFELMKKLPDLLRQKTIEEILAMPDFVERINYYQHSLRKYEDFLRQHAKIYGDAIVIDLRGVKEIPAGNRFLEYTLFPQQNISIRLIDGRAGNTAISVGYSTITRTATIDVGSLMLRFGGGGHRKVGTCQVPSMQADDVLQQILKAANR